jgi:hypothetical protein
MRAHPGRWTFNFGYVAVPQREYFAVRFDEKATVVSGTAARTRSATGAQRAGTHRFSSSFHSGA